MPTVPTYDSFQAAPGTLPRVEVANYSLPDVAGKQAQQFGQGMMQFGGALGKEVAEAVQQANEVRAIASDSELAKFETLLGYEENGAFNQQGESVLPDDKGVPFSNRYLAEFNKKATELSDTLQNDHQRALFQARVEARRTDFFGRLLKHESEQVRKFQDSTFSDAISIAQNEALAKQSDPAAYQAAVLRAADLAGEQARRKGEPVEQARIKAVGRIEYMAMYNRIQGAARKEDLFIAKGVLSNYNPNLAHEDQNRLMSMVNDRIDRFDRDAETALKQSQGEAMKEMTNLVIQGRLTPDIVLDNSDRLSSADRNTLAGILRGGVDDLNVMRRLQIGVLTGTVGEKELTRAAGSGQIAPDTYRGLMGDVRALGEDQQRQTERRFDTEEYKAAREFIRLNVPAKPAGGGGMFDFMLSSDDSERLANALTALYKRAKEGKTDHLKWAQEAVPMFKTPGKPAASVPAVPKTPSSGPITVKGGGPAKPPAGNELQIPPEVQRARDDKRVEILRSELAAERANLAIAKTPADRKRAEQNIKLIGRELQRMGVKP